MKKLVVSLAVAAAALAIPATALASSPMGAWSDVESLEFQPSEATATKVVIHGVFALNTGSTTAWSYTAPKRGYMFFTCPVGSEDTCRLAWADLKKTIGTLNCAGYGEYYKAPGTIRDEGTALATPDVWVIGTGVYATSYAGGTCDLLKKVADPAGDAGPGDSGPSDTGTKTDSGTTPPADSGTTPPADSGTTPPADSGGTSGDTGSGGPASNSSKDSGGCSVGPVGGGADGVGVASGAGSVFGLAAMLLAVARRRRNRA